MAEAKPTVPCDLCKKSFSSNRSLVIHKQRCHFFNLKKNFECDVCGKKFFKGVNLRIHYRVHTGEKPYVCNVCQRSFSQKYSLKTHMMAVHEANRPYSCDICSKSFTVRCSLQKHKETHNEGNPGDPDDKKAVAKPFECDLCPETFKSKKELSFHFKIHTNEKVYPCEKCTKVFAKKKSLANHVKTFHEGKKEFFRCTYCEKTFTQKNNLSTHLKLHTSGDSLSCVRCQKVFSRKELLQSHMERGLCIESATTNNRQPPHANIQTAVQPQAQTMATGSNQTMVTSSKPMPSEPMVNPVNHIPCEQTSTGLSQLAYIISDVISYEPNAQHNVVSSTHQQPVHYGYATQYSAGPNNSNISETETRRLTHMQETPRNPNMMSMSCQDVDPSEVVAWNQHSAISDASTQTLERSTGFKAQETTQDFAARIIREISDYLAKPAIQSKLPRLMELWQNFKNTNEISQRLSLTFEMLNIISPPGHGKWQHRIDPPK